MTPQTKQFILEHAEDNVRKLALQSARFPLVDMPLALRQIAGRQKIKLKIPLFYENENMLYPAQLSLEQSSSELTAYHKSTLCKGEHFADLTGGFGIDCYFISKNFRQTTYIERNTELCEIAKHNFKVLGAENIQVVNMQSEDYLKEMNPIDVIYIDPARRDTAGNKVVLLSDCEPNVAGLSSLLLSKAKNILIKLSPMLDITLAIKSLPQTSEVHIVSVENECKEILLVLNNDDKNELTIKTINLLKNNIAQTFDYRENEESIANIEYSSNLHEFLYEPNSSVMKSGAFKLVAFRFGLEKLHKNTHLYTSDKLVTDFPGRIFKIELVYGSSKNDIKKLQTDIRKANITVRNYPLTVNELRKKTGILDGGDVFIFACKLSNEKNVIIKCTKV